MATSKLIQFKVSAPGKVILHGEHAVVYGKPAIAAGIGTRNHLIFKELGPDRGDIKIAFQALNFVISSDIIVFNKLLANIRHNVIDWDNFEEHQIILEILKKFIKEQLLITNEDERNFKSSLSLLYVMSGILLSNKIDELRAGFTLEFLSEIKIGAGLGSSASFAVCLATAFLILARRVDSQEIILSPEHKNLISKWAFDSEKIMHGKPSGIDNTVCTFGGVLKFTTGLPSQRINIRRSFNILLVDTKVSRSTANLVKIVSKLKHRYPKVIESILTSIGNCVDEAEKIYETDPESDDSYFEKLSELFQVNNGLLRAIGVSHVKLEEIFLIAQKHGFTSKLTGAGGGGYAIVLLPYDYKNNQNFKNLCSDLDKGEFEWNETTFGEAGISVEFFE